MSFPGYNASLPISHVLGWTLLHFLWQGALVALVLGWALAATRRGSANLRYLICCAGMALMMLFPLTTFLAILDAPGRAVGPAASHLLPIRLDSSPYFDRLSPLLPWLSLFWIFGTGLFQGRLMLQWLHMQRLKAHGRSVAPRDVRRMVRELSRRLDIKPRVRILESSLARAPMVMGWLSPIILVPGSVFTGLPPRELETVLAHELAHIRRHDYIVNLVQAVFESLLFYHPAVWWLSNRIRVEREYCCDDVAVRTCRDALCYARALSTLDALCDAEVQTAVASSGGSLMNRIFRIVGVPSKPAYRLGGWLAPIVMVLFMTAALSAMNLLPAAPPDDAVVQPDECGGDPKKTQPDEEELAFKKKVEAMVQKMREEGKSEKEIQKFIEEADAKFAAKMSQKGAPPPSEAELAFKKKVEATVEKMKEEGQPKEEIEKYIKDAQAKFAAKMKGAPSVADPVAEYKKKKAEMVRAMQAECKSEQEITLAVNKLKAQAIAALAKPPKKAVQSAHSKEALAAFKKKVQAVVAEMEAEGKSKEEISEVIKKMEVAFEAAAKKKGLTPEDIEIAKKKKIQATIEKMKEAGKSDEEIKEAVKKIKAADEEIVKVEKKQE